MPRLVRLAHLQGAAAAVTLALAAATLAVGVARGAAVSWTAAAVLAGAAAGVLLSARDRDTLPAAFASAALVEDAETVGPARALLLRLAPTAPLGRAFLLAVAATAVAAAVLPRAAPFLGAVLLAVVVATWVRSGAVTRWERKEHALLFADAARAEPSAILVRPLDPPAWRPREQRSDAEAALLEFLYERDERAAHATGLLAGYYALLAEAGATFGLRTAAHRVLVQRLEPEPAAGGTAFQLQAWEATEVEREGQRVVRGTRYDGRAVVVEDERRWRVADVTVAGRSLGAALRTPATSFELDETEVRIPFVLLGGDGVVLVLDVGNAGGEAVSVEDVQLGFRRPLARPWLPAAKPPATVPPGERRVVAWSWRLALPLELRHARCRLRVRGRSVAEGGVEFEL